MVTFTFSVRRRELFLPASVLLKCFLAASDRELFHYLVDCSPTVRSLLCKTLYLGAVPARQRAAQVLPGRQRQEPLPLPGGLQPHCALPASKYCQEPAEGSGLL